MGNRVVHFEIHTSDPGRAIAFYRDVFGWEFPKWMETPPYWGVVTGPADGTEPGINGGLMSRMGGGPADGAAVNSFVCTVQVDAYDEIHERVLKAGGTVAVPKAALPGMAWQGYYKDPDGNIFGVHQADPAAR